MPHTSRLAVFAGSFDPLTNGHLDLIDRSLALFDRVVVAVLVNPAKQPLFTLDERVDMIRESTAGRVGVEVDTFEGLLAEYVRHRGATAVVRGLRTASEFSDEWPVALLHRQLAGGFETIFLPASAATMAISSRVVREIASLGGVAEALVPPAVAARLAARFRSVR